MIEYTKEDIFETGAAALVNPVNCEGIADDGLAARFKQRFRENWRFYQNQCRFKKAAIGILMIHWEEGDQMIVNFPVKRKNSDPPRLADIEKGLTTLAGAIRSLGIHSIAIPALGCEENGPAWADVKTLIEKKLEDAAECRIEIIPPKEA